MSYRELSSIPGKIAWCLPLSFPDVGLESPKDGDERFASAVVTAMVQPRKSSRKQCDNVG